LKDTTKPIGERYQAIFYLKNINTPESVQAMIDSYQYVTESVLLTHEILYALGQLNEVHLPIVKKFLFERVEDESENGIARH
jgi:HEAT repeat protein